MPYGQLTFDMGSDEQWWKEALMDGQNFGFEDVSLP